MSYTKKALSTRKRIIDTASELFFSKGFSRTKLDEILLVAKVRKGNFYYYFRSKDDLALSVIRESGRPMVISWIRALVDPRNDARENLANLAERLAGSELVRSGRGNPLTNLALEMSTLSDDFRRELDIVMSEVVSLFAEQLERYAKAGHDIGGEPARMAAFLVSELEGSLLLYRLNRNEETLRYNMNVALECVLGRAQERQRA